MFKPKITQYGEKGILLSWKNKIDDEIHQIVLAYQSHIEAQFSEAIQETNIGYQSLLVLMLNESHLPELMEHFEKININNVNQTKIVNYLYHIPVCYHPIFGVDLDTLALSKGLSVSDIISIHTKQAYKIYFTGFLPGFLYLGGLPEVLYTPRRAKPRINVAKGSVAIGGEQTGIYPQDSPGGWHILGCSPVKLFDVTKNPPSLFNSGDFIQFYKVSLNEFEKIELAVQFNAFNLRKELIDD